MSQANTYPLALLADPPTRYVDGAVMDYLLIEAANALRASSTVAATRAKKIEQEMADAGLVPPTVSKSQDNRDSVGSSVTRPASYVDEEDEGLRLRLEALGSHVGANFAEKLILVYADNTFKPLTRISSWEGRAETNKQAKLYVAFPAGLIRGALSRMGLHGTVTPEITASPHCTFQIKLPKNA
ncbi:hypothetical protein ID866_7635 [Astraeus odoratus]|nr:hypothetical protein ID866_7635 [Astraeus odoratus]